MKQEISQVFSEYSERFSQMINYLGISKNKFALDIGYERSQSVYDSERKKTFPSFDFFYKFINSEYSDIIDVGWLITGKGEMLKMEEKSLAINSTKEKDLIEIIKSQQDTIKSQHELIRMLSNEKNVTAVGA